MQRIVDSLLKLVQKQRYYAMTNDSNRETPFTKAVVARHCRPGYQLGFHSPVEQGRNYILYRVVVLDVENGSQASSVE